MNILLDIKPFTFEVNGKYRAGNHITRELSKFDMWVGPDWVFDTKEAALAAARKDALNYLSDLRLSFNSKADDLELRLRSTP
jgi:hypothetical protein